MPELVKDWVLAEADSVANVNTEEAFQEVEGENGEMEVINDSTQNKLSNGDND